MRKYVQKSVSLVMVLSMTAWCVSGCGSVNTQGETQASASEEVTTTESTDDEAVEELLTSKVRSAKKTDKKEIVFVEMKADGTVTNTTVSDKIRVGSDAKIADVSNLKDIQNISGDETFQQDGNKITWENKGKDISYQGTTTESAPVDISVTYYLDDKEISPEDLAGKSGKVKIVYDYTNTTKEEGFVPFLVLTGMLLKDNFTNVEVENGRVVEYEENNIVVGYAVPGFQTHLLDTIDKAEDYIKDIDIPETVTVTADVEDFSLGMVVSVATSELGDLDLNDTLDFSDIEDQMDELQDGADQLVDGADKLNDGAGQLKDGASQLSDGASKLKDGSSKVNKGANSLAGYIGEIYLGLTSLNSNYVTFNKALIAAVKSVNSGTKQIYQGAKDLQSGTESAASGTKKLKDGSAQLYTGAKSLESGINQIAAGFTDTKDASGKVTQQGLNNGAKALADGAKEANAGVQQVVNTLQSTPDSIQIQIDQIITKLTQATGGAISSEAALNKTVEAINGAVAGGMELNTVLAANGLDAKTYYTLLQAYYSVQTLNSVKATFEAQIEKSGADITKLVAGMQSLEDGSSALNTGIGKLYAGVQQVAPGAESLTSGIKTLDNGLGDLLIGSQSLDGGAKKLKKALKQLYKGTTQMQTKLGDASPKILEGIVKLVTGTKQVNEGANTLAKGTKDLDDGVDTLTDGAKKLDGGIISLADGTKELKDGVIKLNKEGISKITELFGEDAQNAVDEIEDTLNAGKDYTNFSGISNGMSGEVKFIFKTDEIKAE